MYFYDLLFLNGDRHFYNWGLVKVNNEYRVMIFDNENIFSIFLPYIRFNSDIYNDSSKDNSSRICADLKAFLQKCPKEYLDELYKMIDEARIENVTTIIRIIENENNTKLDPLFLKRYTSHYNKIKAIILEHQEKNRAR